MCVGSSDRWCDWGHISNGRKAKSTCFLMPHLLSRNARSDSETIMACLDSTAHVDWHRWVMSARTCC